MDRRQKLQSGHGTASASILTKRPRDPSSSGLSHRSAGTAEGRPPARRARKNYPVEVSGLTKDAPIVVYSQTPGASKKQNSAEESKETTPLPPQRHQQPKALSPKGHLRCDGSGPRAVIGPPPIQHQGRDREIGCLWIDKGMEAWFRDEEQLNITHKTLFANLWNWLKQQAAEKGSETDGILLDQQAWMEWKQRPVHGRDLCSDLTEGMVSHAERMLKAAHGYRRKVWPTKCWNQSIANQPSRDPAKEEKHRCHAPAVLRNQFLRVGYQWSIREMLALQLLYEGALRS